MAAPIARELTGARPAPIACSPYVRRRFEPFRAVSSHLARLRRVAASASSPSFAAMVSLLNEARLKAGKPQMGFLNPFLYANPDAFFDVVKGTNAYGRGPFTTPVGFACAPGWDAATGLGTPHYDKLLAAALTAAPSSMVEAA